MSKAWKAFELWFARQIGGERAGAVGREGPDVLHPYLAPECKERKRPIKTLDGYMTQAINNAPIGKIPLVVLHTLGEQHERDLVIMRVKDWLQITPVLKNLGGNDEERNEV